ncbi:hypothetical protein AEST_11370 [Alishewanella aestuarii B11]|uniref:Uncharacterized protein n=1 Tax=Alishewanella aestuarii B11 TaxID=1197174 RepID=J1YDR5_9ALTE|nr:hypothetical protein AEST_11370 [Alishewanella aestuarii B11]
MLYKLLLASLGCNYYFQWQIRQCFLIYLLISDLYFFGLFRIKVYQCLKFKTGN